MGSRLRDGKKEAAAEVNFCSCAASNNFPSKGPAFTQQLLHPLCNAFPAGSTSFPTAMMVPAEG